MYETEVLEISLIYTPNIHIVNKWICQASRRTEVIAQVAPLHSLSLRKTSARWKVSVWAGRGEQKARHSVDWSWGAAGYRWVIIWSRVSHFWTILEFPSGYTGFISVNASLIRMYILFVRKCCPELATYKITTATRPLLLSVRRRPLLRIRKI